MISNAQYLEGNIAFGTNLPYLIEQLQGSIFDYSAPFQGSASLSLAQSDSTLGLVLLLKNQRFVRTNSSINNRGQISSTSLNIGIEKLNRIEDYGFGYRAMFGISRWTEPDFFIPITYDQLDITINAIVSLKLTNRLKFELHPGIVWMDLAGTFRDPNDWQFGREDISPFIDFSLRYTFWK